MGGWGRQWMATTASEPAVETVGYVDPSEVARAATIRAGASPSRLFPDLETALRATDANAALVTTAIGFHVPMALEALAAGLHVLLEKPFAPTLDEALLAVRAADAAGRTLMISQNYRHHPAPRLASELVANGEVGAVASVSVDFRRHPIDMRGGRGSTTTWPTRSSPTWRSTSSTSFASSSDASRYGSRWSRSTRRQAAIETRRPHSG